MFGGGWGLEGSLQGGSQEFVSVISKEVHLLTAQQSTGSGSDRSKDREREKERERERKEVRLCLCHVILCVCAAFRSLILLSKCHLLLLLIVVSSPPFCRFLPSFNLLIHPPLHCCTYCTYRCPSTLIPPHPSVCPSAVPGLPKDQGVNPQEAV